MNSARFRWLPCVGERRNLNPAAARTALTGANASQSVDGQWVFGLAFTKAILMSGKRVAAMFLSKCAKFCLARRLVCCACPRDVGISTGPPEEVSGLVGKSGVFHGFAS